MGDGSWVVSEAVGGLPGVLDDASADIAEQIGCGEDRDDDGRATGIGKVGVCGFDGAVFDPPTDAHDGQGIADEEQAHDADEAEERDEHHKKEGEDRPCHDLEVAGVADGGTDAAGGGGGLLGCCVVNGCAAELALLHGGVDRLLAVRAWEDLDGTQIKCACHG